MSDFWQAPGNGAIVNLDHVVSVDRQATGGDLRIATACTGVTLTLKAGSPDEASFLKAIGERIGSAGQLIAALGDIREAIDRVEHEVKPR